MKGNLHDMGIADLIQHNCQDRKTAQVSIQHDGRQAVLFFRDGEVVHAGLEDRVGEEVVYEILKWEDGTFETENSAPPPKTTIHTNWSGLLLEGARRLDERATPASHSVPEERASPVSQSVPEERTEVHAMATSLESILKEMGGEITGFLAGVVAGMDGINLASHAKSTKVDTEAISAQMTMLFKLVDTSTAKLAEVQEQTIEVEDNLLTTEGAYVLMRYLPGKQYYVGVIADRKGGNLGNLRLISKLYGDRLAKAMPK
jgi:predicted regulator of Ras-like GTPase activity (Roadblock/LC7/MglB family)